MSCFPLGVFAVPSFPWHFAQYSRYSAEGCWSPAKSATPVPAIAAKRKPPRIRVVFMFSSLSCFSRVPNVAQEMFGLPGFTVIDRREPSLRIHDGDGLRMH